MQKLQNKAMTLIMKSSLRDKTTPLIRKLKILKLQNLFIQDIVKILQQFTLKNQNCIKNIGPKMWNEVVPLNNQETILS